MSPRCQSEVGRLILSALILSLALFCRPTMAETYHVSKAGSDKNDGRTPETAWCTLERVNSVALAPGDSVLFRRGDAWRGQLRPCSGDDAAPITYGAFGTGKKPVLLGSVKKNRTEDWTDEGGNLWSTQEPQSGGVELLKRPAADPKDSGWKLYTENGAAARLLCDASGMQIECATPGTSGSDMQCFTAPFPIESGKAYMLVFRARSGAPLRMAAPTLMRSGSPWSPYGHWAGGGGFALADEWTTCTCYYAASQTANDARLTFFLGTALSAGNRLSLDAISLRECRADGFLLSDVGNIIFDGEKSCGVKVWEPKDLDMQGKFWYDEVRHVLKLYSTANPAAMYTDIECAVREHIIDQTNRHHVAYDGLALRYGAAHGIGGGGAHHVTVRDCDISYIGGGDQMGGDKTVRFGNGIEFWGTAHDCLVERCRLWEVYDAALTNQSGGPLTPQYNITYRYNVIWNSEYSFEYWNRPEASETHHILFEHNTCFNAGSGWGHAQRPDPSGRHLCFYTSPARAHDMIIRDNIFCGALENAFYAPTWPRAAIDALAMDHNSWFQPSGDMIFIDQHRYPMAAFADYQKEYAKEPHSLTAEPGVVNAAERDFHLQAGSPCVDAGGETNATTDIEGVPVPQGSAADLGAHERR